jgi:8-oxo-dGTP diphosphatase
MSAGVSVAVDVVVFTVSEERLEVVLVRRRHEPFRDRWALPGGFVGAQESLEDAARRELREETGISDVYLEQLYTFGDPGRDPRGRVVSVAYYALVRREALRLRAGDDAAEARLFAVRGLPPLAFDHDRIVATALARLRAKLVYSTVGFQLLPARFTLGDLQRVYEVILDRRLDKRNFRRKVLSLGLLRPAGRARGGRGRPAQQYAFRTQRILMLDGQLV